MSFEELKRRSENKDALIQKLTSMDDGEKKSYKDDRFWRPTVDDAGTASAVIRFLPEASGEEDAWVLYFNHAFQGPGGWFIENSRTTFGEKDPVSEMNSKLWNSGLQSNKDLVSQKYKRKKNFVSNILVINDSGNPENNGKVFLYRYGMKIHQKIMDAMKPEFADEEPIVPFDFWQGANFRLRQRKVAGYPNYDKSEFDSPSALFDGDEEKLKAIWEQQYALSEFVDPTNYKSYDELKTRLESVLGGSQPTTTAESVAVNEAPVTQTEDTVSGGGQVDREEVQPDSEESALDYFQRLAAED